MTALSVLIGGFITFFVSRTYYKRAAEELKKESAEARRLTRLVLCAMENVGLATLARDEAGTIVGIDIKVNLEGVSATGAAGSLTARVER
jgi:hypothetical protein